MADIKGQLVRENKGWLFVTKLPVSLEEMQAITNGWARISDLPILVFAESELFVPEDGNLTVREVTLAT